MTAVITPAKNAVAGDYAITVRSSAGSESSNVDLRFALKGSRVVRSRRDRRDRGGHCGARRRLHAVRAAVMPSVIRHDTTSPPARTAPSVAVRADGLTKRYGETVAVDALLTLDIYRGEVFGLLGPNGAGKTTTILMLLGLTEPTSGSAIVDGMDPTRDPLRVKSRVGYLPDDVGFYEAMSGRDNLRYTAALNRLPFGEGERRVEELLTLVGLGVSATTRSRGTHGACASDSGFADACREVPVDPDPRRADRQHRSGRGTGTARAGRPAERRAGCDGDPVVTPAAPGRAGVRSDRTSSRGSWSRLGTVEELATDLDQWVFAVGVDGIADPANVLAGVVGVVDVRPADGRLVVVASREREVGRSPDDHRSRWLPHPSGPPGRRPRRDLPPPLPRRRRRPRMTATDVTADTTYVDRKFRGGWRIIARKEFADHVCSVRFVILLVLVSLAGLAAVHSASWAIRDAADSATQTPSVFLLLFTLSPELLPRSSRVPRHPRATARDRIRLRRDQRRACPGHAPPAGRPTHPSRRDHQRQVRGRHRRHRPRPRMRHRHRVGVRGDPPRRRADERRSRPDPGVLHRRDRLHLVAVGPRPAALGREPSGSDGGARRDPAIRPCSRCSPD